MRLLSAFLLTATTCAVIAATGGAASAAPEPDPDGGTTTIVVKAPGADLPGTGTTLDGALVIALEHGSW